jgi:hypothetical protein
VTATDVTSSASSSDIHDYVSCNVIAGATQSYTNKSVFNTKVAATLVASSFRYSASAAQPVAAATYTKVMFPNKDFDSLGEFSGTTHAFTPKLSGVYGLSSAVFWDVSAIGNRLAIRLVKNGTAVAWGTDFCNGASNVACSHISTLLKLAAGDVITVEVFSAASINTNPTGSVSVYFSGVRVS